MKYFGKFDPIKNERLEIMDQNGKIINPQLMPKISKSEIINAYKLMCLSRMQDNWQNKWQRQGRMLSFLSSTGQEACEVAYALQVKQGVDWFSSAYRNNAAWLTLGVPMHNIMLYWGGNEMGSKMPENVNVLPVCIPIATQYSHATGLGFAEKYKNGPGIVFTTTGDGGTNEGEFYEAMNMGRLHDVPVIYCVENNHFAISTPLQKTTHAINFAVKGIANGIRSIKVDGNDFFACFAVSNEAAELARQGKGPSLIEFDTYRLGPHSSSDDPKVYRDQKEYENALLLDPLVRFKAYLINKKWWTQLAQDELDKEQELFVKDEFKLVETNNKVELLDVFNYLYDEMPPALQEQYQEAKVFFDNDKGEK